MLRHCAPSQWAGFLHGPRSMGLSDAAHRLCVGQMSRSRVNPRYLLKLREAEQWSGGSGLPESAQPGSVTV